MRSWEKKIGPFEDSLMLIAMMRNKGKQKRRANRLKKISKVLFIGLCLTCTSNFLDRLLIGYQGLMTLKRFTYHQAIYRNINKRATKKYIYEQMVGQIFWTSLCNKFVFKGNFSSLARALLTCSLASSCAFSTPKRVA